MTVILAICMAAGAIGALAATFDLIMSNNGERFWPAAVCLFCAATTAAFQFGGLMSLL
jgi:hypothetical protein